MTSQRRVLRRFDRTPVPLKATDVVCPHFMLLAWANGCMYNCSWCYLKGTFRFYGQKPNGRVPIIIKDRARIEKEVRTFLKKDLLPELINTGELSDSLLDETRAIPFSKWILRLFKGTGHKVLFLTKSTNIHNFLINNWQDSAILAWSVNAVPVAERWEKLAPTVAERLNAARQVSEAGYEVRLRIDPMVPVENWKTCYSELVDLICRTLKPGRVTLGCLRGLNSTIAFCKDKSWIKYLTEESNWGKKPPLQQRLDMFKLVITVLKEKGFREIGICKETLAIWKALKMDHNKNSCNCLC